MRFTITRSKWLRGEGGVASALLRHRDGKQCCVGQMCSQLGIPDDEIRNEKAVAPVIYSVGPERIAPLVVRGVSGNWCQARWLDDAYSINDARDISDDARECSLRELLAPHGHELVFVD
jgi:hypothetical protein